MTFSGGKTARERDEAFHRNARHRSTANAAARGRHLPPPPVRRFTFSAAAVPRARKPRRTAAGGDELQHARTKRENRCRRDEITSAVRAALPADRRNALAMRGAAAYSAFIDNATRTELTRKEQR
jgi:hypothetical protein